MKHFIYPVLIATLLGCGAGATKSDSELVDTTLEPVIEFIAKTDMKEWEENAQDVRWGIAVSELDIVTVKLKEQPYNEGVYELPEYDKFVVKAGIKSFERVLIPVNAGIHDWLILVDLDNNKAWDGYLGTTVDQIQLDQIEFKNGYVYSVTIDEGSIANLEVKPNRLNQ